MTIKLQKLQDQFLGALRKEKVTVSMFLVNGIKLVGQIESFDRHIVILRSTAMQTIYKHAISSILPSREIKWNEVVDAAGQ